MPGNALRAIPLLYRTPNHRHALRVFADAASALGSWGAQELKGLLKLEGGPLAAIARAAEDEHVYTSELLRLITRANDRLSERSIEPEDHGLFEATGSPLELLLWSDPSDYAAAKITAVSGKDGHHQLDDIFRVELTMRAGRAAIVISAGRADYYAGFHTAVSSRMFEVASQTGCTFSPVSTRVQEDLDDLQELLEGVRLR